MNTITGKPSNSLNSMHECIVKTLLKFVRALLADIVMGDRALGHGRRWESFIVVVNGYYSVILTIIPHATKRAEATIDLFWGGYGLYVALIVWIMFLTSFFGLFFNVYGIRYSQVLRMVGGMLGFLVWGWFGLKLALIGLQPSPGHVFCVVAALYEIRVVFMAMQNLPRPGAAGNWGMRLDSDGAR